MSDPSDSQNLESERDSGDEGSQVPRERDLRRYAFDMSASDAAEEESYDEEESVDEEGSDMEGFLVSDAEISDHPSEAGEEAAPRPRRRRREHRRRRTASAVKSESEAEPEDNLVSDERFEDEDASLTRTRLDEALGPVIYMQEVRLRIIKLQQKADREAAQVTQQKVQAFQRTAADEKHRYETTAPTVDAPTPLPDAAPAQRFFYPDTAPAPAPAPAPWAPGVAPGELTSSIYSDAARVIVGRELMPDFYRDCSYEQREDARVYRGLFTVTGADKTEMTGPDLAEHLGNSTANGGAPLLALPLLHLSTPAVVLAALSSVFRLPVEFDHMGPCVRVPYGQAPEESDSAFETPSGTGKRNAVQNYREAARAEGKEVSMQYVSDIWEVAVTGAQVDYLPEETREQFTPVYDALNEMREDEGIRHELEAFAQQYLCTVQAVHTALYLLRPPAPADRTQAPAETSVAAVVSMMGGQITTYVQPRQLFIVREAFGRWLTEAQMAETAVTACNDLIKKLRLTGTTTDAELSVIMDMADQCKLARYGAMGRFARDLDEFCTNYEKLGSTLSTEKLITHWPIDLLSYIVAGSHPEISEDGQDILSKPLDSVIESTEAYLRAFKTEHETHDRENRRNGVIEDEQTRRETDAKIYEKAMQCVRSRLVNHISRKLGAAPSFRRMIMDNLVAYFTVTTQPNPDRDDANDAIDVEMADKASNPELAPVKNIRDMPLQHLNPRYTLSREGASNTYLWLRMLRGETLGLLNVTVDVHSDTVEGIVLNTRPFIEQLIEQCVHDENNREAYTNVCVTALQSAIETILSVIRDDIRDELTRTAKESVMAEIGTTFANYLATQPIAGLGVGATRGEYTTSRTDCLAAPADLAPLWHHFINARALALGYSSIIPTLMEPEMKAEALKLASMRSDCNSQYIVVTQPEIDTELAERQRKEREDAAEAERAAAARNASVAEASLSDDEHADMGETIAHNVDYSDSVNEAVVGAAAHLYNRLIRAAADRAGIVVVVPGRPASDQMRLGEPDTLISLDGYGRVKAILEINGLVVPAITRRMNFGLPRSQAHISSSSGGDHSYQPRIMDFRARSTYCRMAAWLCIQQPSIIAVVASGPRARDVHNAVVNIAMDFGALPHTPEYYHRDYLSAINNHAAEAASEASRGGRPAWPAARKLAAHVLEKPISCMADDIRGMFNREYTTYLNAANAQTANPVDFTKFQTANGEALPHHLHSIADFFDDQIVGQSSPSTKTSAADTQTGYNHLRTASMVPPHMRAITVQYVDATIPGIFAEYAVTSENDAHKIGHGGARQTADDEVRRRIGDNGPHSMVRFNTIMTGVGAGRYALAPAATLAVLAGNSDAMANFTRAIFSDLSPIVENTLPLDHIHAAARREVALAMLGTAGLDINFAKIAKWPLDALNVVPGMTPVLMTAIIYRDTEFTSSTELLPDNIMDRAKKISDINGAAATHFTQYAKTLDRAIREGVLASKGAYATYAAATIPAFFAPRAHPHPEVLTLPAMLHTMMGYIENSHIVSRNTKNTATGAASTIPTFWSAETLVSDSTFLELRNAKANRDVPQFDDGRRYPVISIMSRITDGNGPAVEDIMRFSQSERRQMAIMIVAVARTVAMIIAGGASKLESAAMTAEHIAESVPDPMLAPYLLYLTRGMTTIINNTRQSVSDGYRISCFDLGTSWTEYQRLATHNLENNLPVPSPFDMADSQLVNEVHSSGVMAGKSASECAEWLANMASAPLITGESDNTTAAGSDDDYYRFASDPRLMCIISALASSQLSRALLATAWANITLQLFTDIKSDEADQKRALDTILATANAIRPSEDMGKVRHKVNKEFDTHYTVPDTEYPVTEGFNITASEVAPVSENLHTSQIKDMTTDIIRTLNDVITAFANNNAAHATGREDNILKQQFAQLAGSADLLMTNLMDNFLRISNAAISYPACPAPADCGVSEIIDSPIIRDLVAHGIPVVRNSPSSLPIHLVYNPIMRAEVITCLRDGYGDDSETAYKLWLHPIQYPQMRVLATCTKLPEGVSGEMYPQRGPRHNNGAEVARNPIIDVRITGLDKDHLVGVVGEMAVNGYEERAEAWSALAHENANLAVEDDRNYLLQCKDAFMMQKGYFSDQERLQKIRAQIEEWSQKVFPRDTPNDLPFYTDTNTDTVYDQIRTAAEKCSRMPSYENQTLSNGVRAGDFWKNIHFTAGVGPDILVGQFAVAAPKHNNTGTTPLLFRYNILEVNKSSDESQFTHMHDEFVVEYCPTARTAEELNTSTRTIHGGQELLAVMRSVRNVMQTVANYSVGNTKFYSKNIQSVSDYLGGKAYASRKAGKPLVYVGICQSTEGAPGHLTIIVAGARYSAGKPRVTAEPIWVAHNSVYFRGSYHFFADTGADWVAHIRNIIAHAPLDTEHAEPMPFAGFKTLYEKVSEVEAPAETVEMVEEYEPMQEL